MKTVAGLEKNQAYRKKHFDIARAREAAHQIQATQALTDTVYLSTNGWDAQYSFDTATPDTLEIDGRVHRKRQISRSYW